MNRIKILRIALIGIACLTIVAISVFAYIDWRSRNVKFDEGKTYKVVRVIDGDTFVVRAYFKDVTIRMLGINTPETVDPRKPAECYGKEASLMTKNLIADSKVRLVADHKRESKDRYGRYLMYVYRDDKLFVNEFLIQNGYAREYTVGKPYKEQKVFRQLESQAKESEVGLWNTNVCPVVEST